MAKQIFYSWQSDLPNSTNRDFLESVLKESIREVATNMEFTEAERDEGLELDKDTKGVPGNPPIADSIFGKISTCAVFVPDLSFVGSTADGRQLPNPNVLIEYGYALSAVGYCRIVPIMNTAHDEKSMESLPFNMRHRRHPLTYSLAKGATKEEKNKVKQTLIKEVSKAILLILKKDTEPAAAPALHEPTPSTTDPSTFLQDGETLPLPSSYFKYTDRNFRLPQNQHMYLRIMPIHTTAPLSSEKQAYDLLSNSNVTPLEYEDNGRDSDRNKYGAFVVSHKENNIFNLTQLFLNNELWGIDCYLLDKERCMKSAKVKVGFLQSGQVEKTFISTLATYLSFYRDRLELQPPIKFMAGMTGVEGYRMEVPDMRPGFYKRELEGKVLNDNIKFETTINDLDVTPASILRPFFEHVWEKCGLKRPDKVWT